MSTPYLECPCCGGAAFESENNVFREDQEAMCGCRVNVEVDDTEEPRAFVGWDDSLPCPECDGVVVSWLWWYLALDVWTYSNRWWRRRPMKGWWRTFRERNFWGGLFASLRWWLAENREKRSMQQDERRTR